MTTSSTLPSSTSPNAIGDDQSHINGDKQPCQGHQVNVNNVWVQVEPEGKVSMSMRWIMSLIYMINSVLACVP